jgi:hypothetical protein
VSNYHDRLFAVIEQGSAVVLVGTGVSKALAQGAETSDWVGLIRDGIDRVDRDLVENAGWSDHKRSGLKLACEHGDTVELISVASAVGNKLRGHSKQLFADWLRDTVGALEVKDSTLATSISNLGTPILTTNYDTLLEKALGRDSADWTETEHMRDIFKGDSKKVGHLHGIHTKPDSVILTEGDYTKIIGNPAAQFIQQTHYASKSFIYIGYGSGLDDPNFSKLIEWHAELFPESRSDHFRLCLEKDESVLRRAHAGHDIRVVPYGQEYSDLPKFLEGLRPASLHPFGSPQKRDTLAYAREAITEQIREEIVIAAELEDIEERDLGQLTVPPVFLPYSHDQFASLHTAKGNLKPKRLGAGDLYKNPKILIVAGEEHSGVSTAIRWLIAQASLEFFELPPIYVDMRQAVSTAKRPLESLIYREAKDQRLVDTKRSALPDCVLAVDNFLSVSKEIYTKALNDLSTLDVPFVVLGCKQGMEDQLERDLPVSRKTVEKVFLGKLGRSDIRSFVELISPARTEEISTEVLDVLKREHLPRNPFTVSLLISLMVQSRSDRSHSSETAVLDDYINLLLGRNGPVVDARVDLNIMNRESVLAEIAKAFVRQRIGSMSEIETIRIMSEYFNKVQWKNSPVESFRNFCSIRILRQISADKVQFQQSSYLHLFAAKAAISDPEFLTELLADPLFFAPIVAHYAALVRNSGAVVERMQELVQPYTVPEAPEGKAFKKLEKRAAPDAIAASVGMDMDQADELPAEETGGAAEQSEEPEYEEYEEYDITDDQDRVPFPLVDTSQFQPSERLAWTIELASRVLRDSDQVPNADLKNQAFAEILCAWGFLIELWEREDIFTSAIRPVVRAMVEHGDVAESEEESVAAQMAILLPAITVMSGIASYLASNKLLVPYDELATNASFNDSPYGKPMAALFAAWVQADGWTERLPELADEFGDRWIVSDFLYALMMMAYRSQVLSRPAEDHMLQFFKTRHIGRYNYKDDATRKVHLGELNRRLRESRALHIRNKDLPKNSFENSLLDDEKEYDE